MVGTIVPAGSGKRGEIYMVALYVLGALVGGLVLGAVLTFTGEVVQQLVHWPLSCLLLGTFFLLASAREVEIVSFRLPQSRWQVPRAWLYGFGDYLAAFLFGGVLGAAFFTPVVCISFYAIVAWIVLGAGKTMGILLALVYAAGRISPVVYFSAVAAKTGRRSILSVRAVDRHRSLVFVLNGILLAALGSLVLAKAWNP
jgi:hypothetical protein